MPDEENLPAIPQEDLGAGFEDMEGQDFSAPFLSICQQMSPYVNPAYSMYIENAKLGLIINTMTNGVYEKINFIPCKYAFKNVEWKPRSSGGGFVRSYSREDTPNDLTIVDPIKGTVGRPNGNVIVPTAYYLVLIEEEGWDRVIIPMYSTQLKKSRAMNSLFMSLKDKASGRPLPLFSEVWEMGTQVEHKDQWTYYGWTRPQPINPVMNISTELYNQAKETHGIANFLPEKLLEAASQVTSDSVKSDDTPF